MLMTNTALNDRALLEKMLARQVAPATASQHKLNSAFFRSGGGQIYVTNWNPALREARDDVRTAWTVAAARAVEALQNSGWLAGAINKAVAAVVGTGLKLNAAPDQDELGWKRISPAAGRAASRRAGRHGAITRMPATPKAA